MTWQKKILGFTLSSRTRKWPHTSSCSIALPKTSPSRLRRVGKILLQTHLGSQQLSVHVDPRLFIQPPTDSQTRSTPLFYLSTSASQGCVLSPLLYFLYTVDCISTHPSNTIIKFADDTTIVGLISNRDETAYRDEVCKLTRWCTENNLTLNIKKTKELIIDFRQHSEDLSPLTIRGEVVERVSSFKFLGVHISENLTWTVNTNALVKKKAQLRLCFLRTLNKKPTHLQSCSKTSTTVSLRVSWHTVSHHGTPTAHKQTGQISRKSSDSPCPHWTTSSGHAAFAEPAASCLIQPSPATSSSRCCHLEGSTGPLKLALAGWKIALCRELLSKWTWIIAAPLRLRPLHNVNCSTGMCNLLLFSSMCNN